MEDKKNIQIIRPPTPIKCEWIDDKISRKEDTINVQKERNRTRRISSLGYKKILTRIKNNQK